MAVVKQIDINQVRTLTEKMKAFEQASAFVKVDIEHSVATYSKLIGSGVGAMFALVEGDEIIGGLGCIKAPDLHDGEMTAIECFWLVLPHYRGQGLKLFRAFEKWADDNKCGKRAMIHMADSFPDILSKFYKREGYVLAELHYIKESRS